MAHHDLAMEANVGVPFLVGPRGSLGTLSLRVALETHRGLPKWYSHDVGLS
jgi:hypothetical protein